MDDFPTTKVANLIADAIYREMQRASDEAARYVSRQPWRRTAPSPSRAEAFRAALAVTQQIRKEVERGD